MCVFSHKIPKFLIIYFVAVSVSMLAKLTTTFNKTNLKLNENKNKITTPLKDQIEQASD